MKCQHETTAEVDGITSTGRRRAALQCQDCGAVLRETDEGQA